MSYDQRYVNKLILLMGLTGAQLSLYNLLLIITKIKQLLSRGPICLITVWLQTEMDDKVQSLINQHYRIR